MTHTDTRSRRPKPGAVARRRFPILLVVTAILPLAPLPRLVAQTPAAPNLPAPPSPPVFLPGQAVEVFVRDGKWYPARIVEITIDGRPRVRYDGYGPESDEVVDPRTLRPREEAQPAAPEGGPLQYHVGQKVEVFAKGRWFKATVTESYSNQVKVAYDGTTHSELIAVDPRWLRPDSSAGAPQSAAPVPMNITPQPGGAQQAPAAPGSPAPTPTPMIGSAISAPTGQLPPDGLFVMERRLDGVVERRAVLIDKTGMVFENPTGRMEPFDAENFRAANPTRVGKARLGRGEMEILWGGGRLPAAAPFEKTPDGFTWDMASFRQVKPATAADLAGTYQAGSTEPVRTSDGWTMGSSGMRLDFAPDGSYRRTNADGVVIGEGRYRIDGFTLTLENAGVETRHCAFRFTGQGGESFLYFDGQFLLATP